MLGPTCLAATGHNFTAGRGCKEDHAQLAKRCHQERSPHRHLTFPMMSSQVVAPVVFAEPLEPSLVREGLEALRAERWEVGGLVRHDSLEVHGLLLPVQIVKALREFRLSGKASVHVLKVNLLEVEALFEHAPRGRSVPDRKSRDPPAVRVPAHVLEGLESDLC